MRRTLLAVTITASLLTQGGSLGAAEQLWTLLAGLWSASTNIDAGCGWDPYGGCQPASSPQTDEGCVGDPYGACRPAPAPQIDAGCVFDPYGSPCHPGS